MPRDVTLGLFRRSMRSHAKTRKKNPRDVDLLISDVTGLSSAQIIGRDDMRLDRALMIRVARQLRRRFRGEPLQYIRGTTEFHGREFAVDARVLIPRPETELVVDAVIARAPNGITLVDIGTGSGCIAITVALDRPELRVIAIDRSFDALVVARHNAVALRAPVEFVCGDVLTSVRGPIDGIVSNPPYIPERDLAGLMIEVRDHEPVSALSPGEDPYRIIEQIYAQGPACLGPGGFCVIEIGFAQANDVVAIATRRGWTVERVIDDLAGIPRVVVSSPLPDGERGRAQFR